MHIRHSEEGHILLELSRNELILVNNALNEVCHGTAQARTTRHLGAGWDELEELRRQINKALEGMTKPPDEG